MTVNRQLEHLAGGPPVFGPPKTQASYRTIPLPAIVIDASWPIWPPSRPAPSATYSPMTPVGRSGTTASWTYGAEPRRLSERRTGTGLHALRHYYASLLICAGCSVKVVQTRLGHASAAETLNTYSHMWPDDEDRTRSAVDRCSALSVPSEQAPVPECPAGDWYVR